MKTSSRNGEDVKRVSKPPQKSKARSRVTNGNALLAGDVDHRSLWVRRFRDLYLEHLSDLGGADAASTSEQSIVRRAAAVTVELEQLETKFARKGRAEGWELDLYTRTASHLRRLLESVGLARRQKPVPDLQTYLRTKARGDVIDAEAAE